MAPGFILNDFIVLKLLCPWSGSRSEESLPATFVSGGARWHGKAVRKPSSESYLSHCGISPPLLEGRVYLDQWANESKQILSFFKDNAVPGSYQHRAGTSWMLLSRLLFHLCTSRVEDRVRESYETWSQCLQFQRVNTLLCTGCAMHSYLISAAHNIWQLSNISV